MTTDEEKKAQIEAEKAEIEKNIQKISREKDYYREMLNQYEHDWAVLDDQELAIAYCRGLYKDIEELVHCLFDSVDNIIDTANKSTIPGFSVLFDYSFLTDNGSNAYRLQQKSQDKADELLEIGKRIDGMQTEIAAKINSFKHKLEEAELNLEYLKQERNMFY